MTSKEALKSMCNHCEKLSIRDDFIGCPFRNISNDYCEEFETIEKDLEVLECFKKIDKKELNDFIENQIKYALNENSWLSTCNCDLEKEEPTQDLIKIKEWLENERHH